MIKFNYTGDKLKLFKKITQLITEENLEQESFLQCLRLIYGSVIFLSIGLQNKATS